eukprot:TRINITY_DN283_c4_g1_i1.p1 TRINITY_DN283_c4_g1~~TRINITY_DN283_c4_g1_i1.p1  ORF type:complete len:663 (+),score=162.31 TRINITY_DN283_c4_g1_i1:56-1990(+)
MAVAVLAATIGNQNSDQLSDSDSSRDSDCSDETTVTLDVDAVTKKRYHREVEDPLIYAVPVKASHVITDWACRHCGHNLVVDIRIRSPEEERDDETTMSEEEDQEKIEPTTWRNKLWLVMEPSDDPPPVYDLLSHIVSGLGLIFIVVSVVVFVIETDPRYYRDTPLALTRIEEVCMAYFTAELVLRIISAPDLKKFFTDRYTVIDILSIIPFYVSLGVGSQQSEAFIVIRILRLMRVFRIFKVSKYSVEVNIVLGSLAGSTEGLYLLLFLIFLSTVLFSSTMYFAERESLSFDNTTDQWYRWVQPDPGDYRIAVPDVVTYYVDHFNLSTCSNESAPPPTIELLASATVPDIKERSPYQSILHASWWCLVTLTTVGYGDEVPSSVAGKCIAAVTMLCGTLVIAFPMVIIGQNFQESYKNHKRSTHTRELRRKPNMLRYLRSTKRGSDVSLGKDGKDRIATVRVARQAPASLTSSMDLKGAHGVDMTPVVTPASPNSRNLSAFAIPPQAPAHQRSQSLQVPLSMAPPKRRSSAVSVPSVHSPYTSFASVSPAVSADGESYPGSPLPPRVRERYARSEESRLLKCTSQISMLEEKIQKLVRLREKDKRTQPLPNGEAERRMRTSAGLLQAGTSSTFGAPQTPPKSDG